MNASLLELLEEEKRLYSSYKCSKELTEQYLSFSDDTEDEEEKKAFIVIASKYEKYFKEEEEKLLAIRKEIKKYISFLETL